MPPFKAQHARAQAADGPRGRFQHPHAAIVYAHFRMDRAECQAQRRDRALRGFRIAR